MGPAANVFQLNDSLVARIGNQDWTLPRSQAVFTPANKRPNRLRLRTLSRYTCPAGSVVRLLCTGVGSARITINITAGCFTRGWGRADGRGAFAAQMLVAGLPVAALALPAGKCVGVP